MVKKALVTIVIGDKYEKLAEMTHPTIKAYAERIGADFIVWRDFIGHSIPAYKKLDIGKLLDDYDRVLYLDTDLIVRDDCPDLFDVVPEDSFGAFNEFSFENRIDAMAAFKDDVDWVKTKKYFNTGVFVCSKIHKPIFEPAEEVVNFYEQTLLNYKIYLNKLKTFSLSHKFNRMTLLDWTGENRFDAYIMHYAGCPFQIEDFIQQIRADLSAWETRPEFYPRKIHFDANGGLGDQVCVEPVIRYLKDTCYQKDDVLVTTHYPELFDHLDVKICKKGEAKVEPGVSYFSVSLPPDSKTFAINNHILTHPVEAASLAAFRGQLPPHKKSILLSVHPLRDDVAEIAGKSVLIHAGKSWATKTFPAEFWQSIIDGLTDEGMPVALIGKQVDDVFGYVNLSPIQKTLVSDLRDKLTIRELISVIHFAEKGLVSNDSSPIHIAGAFDNPIHLITIAKADFRILPFRRGAQSYRARSYGTLLPFRFDSNCPDEVKVDNARAEDIVSHLPNPKDVVEGVLKLNSLMRQSQNTEYDHRQVSFPF